MHKIISLSKGYHQQQNITRDKGVMPIFNEGF